jgi:hypothetical protein
MGMYNIVVVESELLPEEFKVKEFQTKMDLEELFSETFTISKEGRLLFERREYEWRPDPEKAKLGGLLAYHGALKTVSKETIDENFHGDFSFYNELVDCVARFTHGQLEYITYGQREVRE